MKFVRFKPLAFKNTLIVGFTLLEVLVAMAISSFIYIGAYSLLNSVLVTDERVSLKREQLENVQRAFHIMQQDIEQIVPRTIRNEFGESQNAIIFSGLDEKLEFTRIGWRNPIKRPRSTMQRVAYLINDNNLIREHWNVLDRVSETESRKNTLLENVDSIEFKFFDGVQNEWISQWDKEISDKQILPSAIEVTLETKSYGELIRVFRLVDNREDKPYVGL
jgi:general secretion pathway protein J